MRVLDTDGQRIAYVRQKLFKFKEEILVYRDKSKAEITHRIKADKVIDWSPKYTLYDANGIELAAAKREGARSLFNATYKIWLGDKEVGTLKERNVWVKFLDSFFSAIPIVEFFTGHILNPQYDLKDGSEQVIATLSKRPAFFEGFYSIEPGKISEYSEDQQLQIALLLMLIAVMERTRG